MHWSSKVGEFAVRVAGCTRESSSDAVALSSSPQVGHLRQPHQPSSAYVATWQHSTMSAWSIVCPCEWFHPPSSGVDSYFGFGPISAGVVLSPSLCPFAHRAS